MKTEPEHTPLEFKGYLTISRPQCANGERYISITVVDDKSGAEFFEAKMDLDAFAEAITGLGGSDCSFILRSALVGKTREHKELVVPTHDSVYSLDDKKLSDLLLPYEKDGWKGRIRDFKNHHRKTKDGYLVLFERYVESTGGRP